METNLYTQVLPLLVMILTLWLIKRNVPFELIPGFDRIGGLLLIVFAVLAVMWLLDRLHIIAITFMPFHYVVLLLVGAFIAVRYGVKRALK